MKYEVTLGTYNKVFVVEKGRVNILENKGEKKYISVLYFFHYLKHNLISIGQLMQKGYNFFIKNGECTLSDKILNKKLIAKVKMTSNRMFHLKIKLDLKEEGAKARMSMISQDKTKAVALIQILLKMLLQKPIFKQS